MIGPTPGTLIRRRQVFLPDDIENLLGQAGELAQHRGQDRKKRLDHRHHLGVVASQFPNAIGEGGSGRRAELDTGFPQDRTHHVLDRPHLVEDRRQVFGAQSVVKLGRQRARFRADALQRSRQRT